MTVGFSTNVYENSYKQTLLSDYIREQLKILAYNFSEYVITVNNVNDRAEVERIIKERFPDFKYYFTDDDSEEVLKSFNLTREDITPGYWYSVNDFCAIRHSESDYLLHYGDDCKLVQLDNHNFVADSIVVMDGNDKLISSMPAWDSSLYGPRNESNGDYKNDNFYAGCGFSDQLYIAKMSVFKTDIYHYHHGDSDRFPIGNTFERRVDAYMRCQEKWRIIHKRSYYDHRSW